MISLGDHVIARKVSFEGRLLGHHGSTSESNAFEYRSLFEDRNARIYAVVSNDTGEIRFFTADAIEPLDDLRLNPIGRSDWIGSL